MVNETKPCSVCGYTMTPLFYSMSCDRCDNPMTGWFHHGYILWTTSKDPLWAVQEHPIFKIDEDVVAYQAHNYTAKDFEIRDVLSYVPFLWIKMFNTDYQVADTYYKVREDHLFDPAKEKPTVILMPSEVILPDQETILLDKDSRVSLGLSW